MQNQICGLLNDPISCSAERRRPSRSIRSDKRLMLILMRKRLSRCNAAFRSGRKKFGVLPKAIIVNSKAVRVECGPVICVSDR